MNFILLRVACVGSWHVRVCMWCVCAYVLHDAMYVYVSTRVLWKSVPTHVHALTYVYMYVGCVCMCVS